MLQRTITILFLIISSFSITTLAAGTQFITGLCSSDADCASSCCGFNSGKCAGPVIAQTRDGGCGHNDPQPNHRAADAFFSSMGIQAAVTKSGTTMTVVATSNPAPGAGIGTGKTSSGSGKPPGTQFITGPCGSDADCASACCGFRSGKCAGPIIAQERDGGCGFGDVKPNSVAADRLKGGSSV